MSKESDDRLRREAELAQQAKEQGDTGCPGGGQGRRDATGATNVWPASGPEQPPGDARPQPMGTFGQPGRGPQGYQDSGDSEVIPLDRLSDGELGENAQKSE